MKKTLHYYSFKSSIGSGIKRFLFSLGLQSKDWVFSRTKNESDITFFSFITSFIFIVLMTLGLSHNVEAQNSYTWNGGGADNNMTTGANWGGSAPGSPQVFLNFAGSNRLTPNNNFSAISGGFQIFFKSGAGSFIVGGNLITFYNYGSPAPLIQNEGTALQTINFPISNGNTANNGDMNINGNGSGGPITFGSTFTTPNGTNNRTLKINNGNGSGTVTFNGAIGQGTGGGKLAFAKNGANSSAILGAANTYTGNTDINAGTLFINGSTSSSSPVTVLSGATLAGNGTAAGSVTLSGIVSPGATSATTANLNTGAFTFNANSSYRFEMNNATGTAGNASGWDKITSTGAITCSASPITLNLVSLSVSNFNPANAYTWPIASASSISGFNASNFTINTASFASFTGIFSVTLTGGNTINLVYLPPSSGPAQPSAISGPTTVCNGTSQTYSVTNDINATSYQWTLPSGWSGTSSTNSITVTVANPSGSLSVVAQNAGGDSFPRSVFVNVGVSTSITTQPSTSAQSVCLGGSVTALSVVAAGSSLTYQWYSNTSQTNSGGTLITGATSSSYTPTAFGTPLYYYCTVGGSCAPTSVSSNASGLISISGLPNDTATYTISNGGNGGQGFGPWAYSVTGGSGGTFTEGNGSNVQIGQAWGLYANGNGITSASRAFVAPMAIGNNVSFAFDNGDVNAANSVGVRLRNASNGILMEFRFLAGASEYSIYDGTGVANTGVTFTTTGLSNVSFAYTGVNTYAISITKAGVTTTINGRTFATVSGGQVPAAIEFFNSNAGNGATKNIYFNALTMGYPKIFVQPVISVQNVCQNDTATTLSVGASGSNLGYQWYSNPGAVLLGGQTASTFSPPTDSPSTKTYYCVVSYTGSCGTVSSITSASSGVVTVFGLPTATISGTATVCQNAPASITFTGANGTPPYEFQYTVYEVGSIYPPGLETVTTTSGSSVTVSVPSSALGGMLYELIGVSSNVGSSPTCTGPASGSVTVTVNASTIFYTDADGDTYGDLASPVESCDGSTPSGTVSDATDCDDNDPSAHEKFSFYVDADGDTLGFGSLVAVCALDALTPPVGYSLNNTDCDDTNIAINATFSFYVDGDVDGYGSGSLVDVCAVDALTPPVGYSLNNTDCDDDNVLVYQLGDFYVDADGDNYSTSETTTEMCYGATEPAGYSLLNLGLDCDDTIAAVNPGMAEIPYDGLDNDCVGGLDNGFAPFTSTMLNCGTTLSNIGSLISCVGTANAVEYKFEVTGPNGTVTIDRNVPYFSLTQLADYQYATTYSVKVMLRRTGQTNFVGYYSTACSYSTPPVTSPVGGVGSTQLQSYCNGTLPTLATLIATTSLPGATGYRFRVTNTETGAIQSIDRSLHWFSLTMLNEYHYGTTYLVDVAVKTTAPFPLEPSFGAPCFVTTPALPSLTAYCGGVVPNKGITIPTTSLNRATLYRFEVTHYADETLENILSVQQIDRTQQWFMFNLVTDYVPNGVYGVRVSVMTSGSFPSSSVLGQFLYGDTCIITSPNIARETTPVATSMFEVVGYPNPYSYEFGIKLDTTSDSLVSIKVYDMIGKLIEQREVAPMDVPVQAIGERFPTGVYNVVVSQDGTAKSLRMIKR